MKQANTFSNFPNSDALTRRLKKMIHAIILREDSKGKIDFEVEASSTDDDKGWNDAEKKVLFNYILNNGVTFT